MYPGMRGRTHGDKKLINPAKKAINIVGIVELLKMRIRKKELYFVLVIK